MISCDKVITVYHKSYDPLTRSDKFIPLTIHNCSWFSLCKSSMSDKGLQSDDLIQVRIPLYGREMIPVISKGDIVVLGDIDDDLSPGKVRSKYPNSFTVMSLGYNNQGSEQVHHIRMSGS